MADRTLKVEIIGDASSLSKALGKATDHSTKFGSSLAKVGKVAAAAFTGAAVAGVAAFAYTLKRGFDEVAESQKVMAQTGAVLESTGQAANVTAKQVEDYATSLSQVSGVDDEVIQSGENMLLTFTNIRNETGKGNDIFKQATGTLLDMSTALGTDMNKSAIQLGKALNDPIKGITALQRVGVSFTAGQKEMIAEMVKSGDTMGAQKMILAELNKEFGGSAKAFGETMPGQLAKLRNSFDEVAGNLATKFLPMLTSIVSWVNAHWPEISAVINAVGRAVTATFQGIGVAVNWLKTQWEIHRESAIRAWEAIRTAVLNFIGFFRSSVLPAIQTVVNAAREVWNRFGGEITTIGGRIVATVKAFMQNMIAPVKIILAVLRGDWSAAWEELKGIVTRTLGTLIGNIRALAGAMLSAGLEIGKSAMRGIFNGLKSIWDTVKGWLGDLGGKVKTAVGDLGDLLYSAGQAVLQGFLDGLVDKFEAIKNFISGIIGWIKDNKGPESKDKEALVKNGQAIMTGLLNGMLSKWPELQKFASSIGKMLGAAVTDKASLAEAKKSGSAIADALISNKALIAKAAKELGGGAVKEIVNGVIGIQPSLKAQLSQAVREAMQAAKEEAAAKAKEVMQAMNQAVVSAKENFKSAFGNVISAALSAFDAMASAWKPPSLVLLDKMNLQEQKDALIKGIQDAERELNEARAKLAEGGVTPEEQAARQQAVLDAEQRLADARLAQTKFNLQQQGQAEQEAHDAQMEKDRQRLEARLTAIQNKYLKEKDLSAAEIRNMNKEIAAAMGEAGIDSKGAGQNISNMLALGIQSAIGEVVKAVNALAKALKKRLKLKSNAEEGELSDIESWWVSLGPMLAGQIDPDPVKRAADTVALAMKTGLKEPMDDVTLESQKLRAEQKELITNLELLQQTSKDSEEPINKGIVTPVAAVKGFAKEAAAQVSELRGELDLLNGKSISTFHNFYETHYVQTIFEGGGGFVQNPFVFPQFQTGGMVPGRLGQPQLAIVHGGEKITPPGASPVGATVNVYVSGSVVSERELAETVRRELIRTKNRNGSLGL